MKEWPLDDGKNHAYIAVLIQYVSYLSKDLSPIIGLLNEFHNITYTRCNMLNALTDLLKEAMDVTVKVR